MSAFSLFPEGVGTRRGASKDAGPNGGGVDLGLSRCSMKGVGMRRGASKDTGPKGRKERVPVRTQPSPSRRLLKL